jgi:glycine/D-amino acid oxidase-like deaminating enzyme
MTRSYDAIIVGAGIVGAACALQCSLEGMRVALIERDVIGGSATAAGMGHIVVMDDSPAQFALTRYSQSLWNEAAEELPADVEYERCGTIWVAADEEEMAEVHRKQSLYQKGGVPVETLDGAALAEAEPNLRRGLAGGLLILSDAVLYPPCAAGYFVRRAQDREADLYLGKEVVTAGGGRVRLNDGTELSSPRIVNAAGAVASAITDGLLIRKRKGHLVITDRYPEFIRHQLVELGYLKSAHSLEEDSVAFNVQPRRTGQILIGSSRQYADESTDVDPGIFSAMLDRATRYMPSISFLSALRIWTGFRAATPDKLPLIGPLPEDPTLFVATGHEGLGITTSVATARLLVDHFCQRTSAIALDPYLPSRLAQEMVHG